MQPKPQATINEIAAASFCREMASATTGHRHMRWTRLSDQWSTIYSSPHAAPSHYGAGSPGPAEDATSAGLSVAFSPSGPRRSTHACAAS